MRTTIDLPDELFRQAKARAALSGVSLNDLIARYVESGLQMVDAPAPAVRSHRANLPETIPPRGRSMPVLSNAEAHAILEVEDAEAGLGSAGAARTC